VSAYNRKHGRCTTAPFRDAPASDIYKILFKRHVGLNRLGDSVRQFRIKRPALEIGLPHVRLSLPAREGSLLVANFRLSPDNFRRFADNYSMSRTRNIMSRDRDRATSEILQQRCAAAEANELGAHRAPLQKHCFRPAVSLKVPA
jgi:hypothetical protein